MVLCCRIYANAAGRIEYRSASLMEIGRVRRELAAARATAAAEVAEMEGHDEA